MKYSRVSRLEEKRTRKQFILVLLGIIGLILFVVLVGIPLIVNASVFLGNLKSNKPLTTGTDTTAPLPPTLASIPIATNSAHIKVEGYGEPDTTLSLKVNDEEVKNALIPADGVFSFSDIPLEAGQNIISATLTDSAGNTSNPARDLQIQFVKEAPKLEVSVPEEGKTYTKNEQEIEVKGTTDPGVGLRLNDRFVSVAADGSFTYMIKLQDGENTLTLRARDSAGNETTLERKVTYQP